MKTQSNTSEGRKKCFILSRIGEDLVSRIFSGLKTPHTAPFDVVDLLIK